MLCKRIGIHDLPLPRQESMGAAGYDLRTTTCVRLFPGERKLIPTGFAFAIPDGMAGIIRPRSGHAVKHGLHVMAGLIDSDYRGEVQVLLVNMGDRPVDFQHGDRIAQMVVLPVYQTGMREVEDLDATERGADGFGSSGLS
jgi:dUTP pyrophosphatase